MVNILAVIFFLLAVGGIVLMLFTYFEKVSERKERQQEAMELIERLRLKVFLLRTDLAHFAEGNNLMEFDFFYNLSFSDCIASVIKVESKCTDPDLIAALQSTRTEKQIDAIISECRSWMLHIDRVSSSLETKRMNPAYNKELLAVA
jgi:hypothetical protein